MTKLGLDLFSLRSQGWNAFELMDYAASLGVNVVHFSEPRFIGNLADSHLGDIKVHADTLGLEIELGFGSICPTSTRFEKTAGTPREQLLQMFLVAQKLGTSFVRCYLGSSEDRQGDLPLAQHIKNTVEACRSVRTEALALGLKIGIENHAGDLQANQLRNLIEEAGSDYVGALIDIGNSTWTLEDPHHTLEVLAPYCLTTGIRDSAVWEVSEGAASQWVCMGEGNIGIKTWTKRFQYLCPDKTYSLEIINLRTPRIFPYRRSDFWKHYKDVPVSVLTGFLNIAQQGKPYSNISLAPQEAKPDSVTPKELLAEQERRDVEQAVRYARETLHIGIA
jgi:sugar phosphate isomerase/epimerase